MPMPQKRRRRRRPTREGPSRRRRRRGEDGASLSGSLVESDSSGTNSGVDGGASLPTYQSLLAWRLARLQLPPSADDDDEEVDRPNLPSGETLEALTRSSFLDDEMVDALVEYEVHKCLSETHGRDSGEFHPAHIAMDSSVDPGDDIPDEDVMEYCEQLRSRRTPVDEYTKLDQEQINELELKYAFYRIKACLLLKGKAIDKLDDAALVRKYPRELILENSCFLNYEKHHAFGWFFDSDLCTIASLTDYQRLVIFNYCGDEYQNWSRYLSFYNTPETDRDYLLYWETITEKLKWIEDYMHLEWASAEWFNVKMKAMHQAIRIATGFDNIHLDLACLGFTEFICNTRLDILFVKDPDGVFFEIWMRVIKEQMRFREALEEVYNLKLFPLRERQMKNGLDGRSIMIEEQFRLCTVGITKEVPEYRARELIAQQVRTKLAVVRGYERYAWKKLKVAEHIGLIRKTST